MSRDPEYALRLFLGWLNERYRRGFAPQNFASMPFAVSDNDAQLAVAVSDLYELDDAQQQRRDELAQRLDSTRPGSYVLWQPPGATLPDGEPYESEWVRRVVLTASKLASGRVGEARLPAKLLLGKMRDEGGYASVTGALGRHWTNISQRLAGSFYLDSRGLNRFTRNEEERERLYENIAMVSQGLKVGDAYEIEHEDAWTLQRLARGPAGEGLEDGWCITGCPSGFDPNDGGAVRRTLRRRLLEAKETLAGAEPGTLKCLVLIGAYDYIEGENAGPSLRGFDPALAAGFDVIALLADGEVKALRMSRGLPFATPELPA
jgi:hypothetical protein